MVQKNSMPQTMCNPIQVEGLPPWIQRPNPFSPSFKQVFISTAPLPSAEHARIILCGWNAVVTIGGLVVARWMSDVAAEDAAAAAAESDVVGWMVFRKAPVVVKMESACDWVPLKVSTLAMTRPGIRKVKGIISED